MKESKEHSSCSRRRKGRPGNRTSPWMMRKKRKNMARSSVSVSSLFSLFSSPGSKSLVEWTSQGWTQGFVSRSKEWRKSEEAGKRSEKTHLVLSLQVKFFECAEYNNNHRHDMYGVFLSLYLYKDKEIERVAKHFMPFVEVFLFFFSCLLLELFVSRFPTQHH